MHIYAKFWECTFVHILVLHVCAYFLHMIHAYVLFHLWVRAKFTPARRRAQPDMLGFVPQASAKLRDFRLRLVLMSSHCPGGGKHGPVPQGFKHQILNYARFVRVARIQEPPSLAHCPGLSPWIRDGRPPTPRLGRLGVSSHSFIRISAYTTLMSHDIARPSCIRAAGFCLRAPVTVYHDSPSTFPIKNVKLLVTVKRNAGISSWSF